MPKQTTQKYDDSVIATKLIGPRIRKKRKKSGQTLEDLASKSGVSKGMLSLIETSQSTPTITILFRIANALDCNISQLVEETWRVPRMEVVKKDDPERMYHPAVGCSGTHLNPPAYDQDVEFYKFQLDGKSTISSKAHAAGTREMIHVLKGQITVISAENTEVLKTGDSALYAADVKHIIENRKITEAVILLVAIYKTEA